MNRTRTMAAAALVAGIAAGTASADPFPGYTDGFTNVMSSPTPGHQTTLEMIYGGSWAGVSGDSRSFTNGTLTATRMLDTVDASGSAGSNFMLDGSNIGAAGVTDQVWQDGTIAATARARYAALDQSFGYSYDDGGGAVDEFLFDVDGNGVNPGASAVSGPIPGDGEFTWLRGGGTLDGDDRVWSSEAAANSDGLDHMVTYVLSSTDASYNGGRPVYLLFFEDRTESDGSNWDYNDLVVEIAVLPLPAALGLGLAGLAGAGLARRRRTLA